MPHERTPQHDAARRRGHRAPDAARRHHRPGRDVAPPYFRLRDYGHAQQLGGEAHVDEWVERLVAVADQVQRVLAPAGTFWLNLGDSYASHPRQGADRKSLLLAPERLALRLIERGWLVRNKLIWQKANPVPTSVPDRFACTWEYVFIFAKSPTYFFDLDAVRQPHTSHLSKRERRTAAVRGRDAWLGPNAAGTPGLAALKAAGLVGHPLGKNPGDLIRLASSNYRGNHHATFPVALADFAIRTGCPERRCMQCRAPWRRRLIRTTNGTARRSPLGPTCACNADTERGMVLDPFTGAGTTALAAEALGRDWLGVELNPDYITLTEQRLQEARGAPPRAA